MSHLYKILPLEKKSVVYTYIVTAESDNGDERRWVVTEYYNYGQAFRELDNPVTKFEYEEGEVVCDSAVGWGNELDDLSDIMFQFDESFDDEEQEEIKRLWDEGDGDGQWGSGWLFEGDHSWQLEDENVSILGPFKVDLVDEDSEEVVEEDIKP